MGVARGRGWVSALRALPCGPARPAKRSSAQALRKPARPLLFPCPWRFASSSARGAAGWTVRPEPEMIQLSTGSDCWGERFRLNLALAPGAEPNLEFFQGPPTFLGPVHSGPTCVRFSSRGSGCPNPHIQNPRSPATRPCHRATRLASGPCRKGGP